MKANRAAAAEPVIKIPLLTIKDRPEYERTKSEIVNVLKQMGGYIPAIDDILVDDLIRAAIFSHNAEIFTDSDTADADMYSRVADIKLKQSKSIERALHQLALARRERLNKQTEGDFVEKLKQVLERAPETGNK